MTAADGFTELPDDGYEGAEVDCPVDIFGCSQSEPCPAYAAATYAARGWRVVPIAAGTKRPAVADWPNLATTDTATLRQWWRGEGKGHGVGIVTGHGSGLFVVDVDVANGKTGDESLRDLEDTYGALPETARVITGSGGAHIYFTLPPGVNITNDAGKRLGAGIDVRGEGGQVLAPPTVHPTTGNRYEWEGGEAGKVAEAPAWLIGLLTVDATPAPTPKPPALINAAELEGPADRYNAETTWAELLGDDGWTFAHTDSAGRDHYTRPGKEKRDGVSGNVEAAGVVFVCHSTSVPYLEVGKGYSRFGYYAAKEYNGDHSAAARAWLKTQPAGTNTAGQGTTSTPAKVAALPPGEPWPDPIPLTGDEKVPPFPVDELPDVLSAFAQEVAAGAGTQPDLLAAFMLPVVATITARRWVIEIKPGHTEPLNLYLAGIAPPGAMKSFAARAATAPLTELEAELAEQYGPEVAQAASARRIEEGQLARAEKDAATGDAREPKTIEAARIAADLAGKLATTPPPVVPQLFVTDATPEALEVFMMNQGNRSAWLDDEGGLFTMTGGRYSPKGKGTNLDVFLKGHEGGTIKVERAGRAPVHINGAALTVGVLTQPAAFGAFVRSDEGRGLLQRFLVTRPALDVVDRSIETTPADRHTVAAYRQRIRELHEESRRHIDAPMVLRFDADAYEVVARSFARHAAELRPGGIFAGDESLMGWGGKLDGATCRLAANLALIENPKVDTVDAVAARRAVALADYFTVHTIKAFGEAGMTDSVRLAVRCLAAVKTLGTDEVSTREVHQKVKGTAALEKPIEVGEVLRFLADYGWIRGPLENPQGKAGRPSERWQVHPQLNAGQ